MIYPKNFEDKIGFNEVRAMLRQLCLSSLGKGEVEKIDFSTDAEQVNTWLEQIREFRRIQEQKDDFPLTFFIDCREALQRIRIANTHLEEDELFDLRRSLDTINHIVAYLQPEEDMDEDGVIPNRTALQELADGVATFPNLVQQIDQILDKFGHIRDTASPTLHDIRRELARVEGSISRTLNNILRTAQMEGVVDKDAAPAMRDGRLVIPVAPALKRKISGIVHDESATGHTVYIEPTEVVEANNRIRELENEERQEIIRILTKFTEKVRPHVPELLDSYRFLAQIDLIQAKASLANQMKAFEPEVKGEPIIDWIQARHPLLERKKKVVPLDITLNKKSSPKHQSEGGNDQRLLIISGPNAGGKSVCLKTVGLLQYMLQCGLSIPLGDRSTAGIFHDIMIDIGDEQSLENDLSTYSSHLLNMKNMMKQASNKTLILIDEFGTGTEPQIGGAIAESVLERLLNEGAWGVITTHYQNLKHFADSHEGVVNGAMLYDRHEMRPLFQLAIGRPGSSFAIEIARKIGLPEDVIKEASDIVGSDYIQSDKYLQDIVRDKRYWEGKRQTIHQREKDMEKTIAKYEQEIEQLQKQRKEIIAKTRQEANELLKESNRRIENAIKEIREKEAEKNETRRIRQELKEFEANINDIDAKANDDAIARKIEQIKARKERHEKRKKEKAENEKRASEALRKAVNKSSVVDNSPLAVGDKVRVKGLTSVGTIESIAGAMATVIFGDMRSKMRLNRLEHAPAAAEPAKTEQQRLQESLGYKMSQTTRTTMDDHRKNFHQDLDVRGMRGDEALNAVQYFIDDAILVGMSRVRILHGKGNGILRQLIRQYLSGIPNVTHYADEHVQFGGAGITVVDL